MWVPCGDWFYTNQTPQASQTIAQYAERRSKANRIRQKPYDRPEGSNLSSDITLTICHHPQDKTCERGFGSFSGIFPIFRTT